MADTYSTYLQIRLPATGAYNNTWGATLNSDAFSLLDAAIAGWASISVGSGTTYSLPALTPGGASNSRYFGLIFTGTPTAQVTVTVPATVTGKMYLVDNQTGQSLLFTYAGSADTVTVNNGLIQLIWCDGSNCWPINASAADSPSLGGVPAADWVQGTYTAEQIADATHVQNRIEIPTAWPWYDQADGSSIAFNCQNGNAQSCTLQGNRTIAAPTNPVDGSELLLLLVQDGTGSRVPNWNSIFWFENGLAPVLGTAPGAADLFWCRYNATLNKWFVGHFYNLNAGGSSTQGITISSSCDNWSLAAVVGAVVSSATYNVVINQGVIITSKNTTQAAVDLSGLISGSVVNLANNGYILGHGGRGGRGALVVGGVNFGWFGIQTAGQNGGPAINGPGSGCTFKLTNAGYVWGGGGGGGVGGYSVTAGPDYFSAGGGGGGAGNGLGGICFPGGDFNHQVAPTDGADGTNALVYNAANGAAGTGAGFGTFNNGVSGAGGTWGTAGTAGTAAAGGHTTTATPTAAGAGGNAVVLNAGSLASGSTGLTSPNLLGAVS